MTSVSAALFAARILEFYPQELPVKGLAIQCAHSGPCLVSFHFDEAETTAFAGEDIGGYLYGPDCAKFRKEFAHVFF